MGMQFSPMYQPVSTKTIKADGDLDLGNYDLIATDVTVNGVVMLNGELVTTPPYQDLNFVAYTIPSTPNTGINYTSEYQVTEIAAVPNVINTLWGSYTNLVVPTISVTFTVKYNSANGTSGETRILFNDVAVHTSALAYNNNTATFTVDCNPTIKNVIKVLGRYLTVTPDITTFYLKRV